MKKFRSLIFAFTIALIAPASVGFIATTVSGCKTSQRTIAYKSMASLHVAVSSALAAWADHVVAERANIASMPETPDKYAADSALHLQEVRVRAALDKYKKAGELAKVGIKVAREDDPLPPPMPVSIAGEEFVQVVSSILRK